MEKPDQLANRFREVLLNGHWVANINFKEALEDLTWQQATKKISSLNTIAALTFHINYYIVGVLNVFEGGDLEIRDKYSYDLPEIRSAEDWGALRERFLINSEKYATHIDQMSVEKLNSTFVDEKYGTYRRNIEGMIEHAYYHLGQVSLIKKMLSEQASN